MSAQPQSSMDDSLTANNPPTSNDHEGCIQAVINAVNAGMSYHHSGAQFNIPTTTITNCIKGQKPMSMAHKNQQLLSNGQKAALIDWCRWHGDIADPLSHAKLSTLVNDLAGQPPSQKWIHNFLRKNSSQITVTKGRGLDPQHVQGFNKPVVDRHFEELQKLIVMQGIPPENIYNEDEKGIQLGGGGRTSPSNTSFLVRIIKGTPCGQIHWFW